MIGNDIVDLSTAAVESNWRRRGYLEKLFNEEERRLILTDSNPDTMVWLLWSMKESAYKCMYRQTRERLFNPLGYRCSIVSANVKERMGTVHYRNRSFQTLSILTRDYVHSSCSAVESLLSQADVYISESPSLLRELNYRKDRYGIPFFINATTEEASYLSISHHGRFCSYISTGQGSGAIK